LNRRCGRSVAKSSERNVSTTSTATIAGAMVLFIHQPRPAAKPMASCPPIVESHPRPGAAVTCCAASASTTADNRNAISWPRG
jgi:hypothetical protein